MATPLNCFSTLGALCYDLVPAPLTPCVGPTYNALT